MLAQIIREVELHRGLRHPNVVYFHSFFEDDTSVYMVLEFCSRKVRNVLCRLVSQLLAVLSNVQANYLSFWNVSVGCEGVTRNLIWEGIN